jgi:hypothetical protein
MEGRAPDRRGAAARGRRGKQRLGVSKHTLIEELGYDAEQEAERRQDEADASMENMQRTFDKGGFDPSGSSSSSDDSDPAAGGGQE